MLLHHVVYLGGNIKCKVHALSVYRTEPVNNKAAGYRYSHYLLLLHIVYIYNDIYTHLIVRASASPSDYTIVSHCLLFSWSDIFLNLVELESSQTSTFH